MTEIQAKPKPHVTKDSEEYWGFAAEGKFVLRRCEDCGTVMYYPRILCTKCMSTNLGWYEAKGRGHIHAFTIVYRAPSAAFKADVPYPLAIIELEEGVRMLSNIVECDPDTLAIGQPVRLVFEQRAEFCLPQFRPGLEP